MKTELYAITFPNGKRYIGLSKNAKKRWAAHRSCAKQGSHLPVHRAIAKHARDVKYKILCIGESSYIADMEVKVIAFYQTRDRQFGYNTAVGGDLGTLGLKHTHNSKIRMSAARKGKPLSAEHKEKLRVAGIGRVDSPETREKKRLAGMGRIKSPESIEKQRTSLTGYVHSVEARANMSAAGLGRVFTAEHKSRISASAKGRIKTAEHRLNLSMAKKALGQHPPSTKGSVTSAETKAKQAASMKAYWAARKLAMNAEDLALSSKTQFIRN